MALQNGRKIALAQRRHRVIQAKIAGRSEAEIAEQEGVAQYTIWKDIRAYLGAVRREDQAAVQAEYDLPRARSERRTELPQPCRRSLSRDRLKRSPGYP